MKRVKIKSNLVLTLEIYPKDLTLPFECFSRSCLECALSFMCAKAITWIIKEPRKKCGG